MHYSPGEKYEIIRLVEGSDLGVIRTLKQLKINKSNFYNWYNQYVKYGYEGLERKKVKRNASWNTIHEADRDKVVEIALEILKCHLENWPGTLQTTITITLVNPVYIVF